MAKSPSTLVIAFLSTIIILIALGVVVRTYCVLEFKTITLVGDIDHGDKPGMRYRIVMRRRTIDAVSVYLTERDEFDNVIVLRELPATVSLGKSDGVSVHLVASDEISWIEQLMVRTDDRGANTLIITQSDGQNYEVPLEPVTERRTEGSEAGEDAAE